ncbi:MAG: hypothetical protein IPI35_22535 [Deltaproteobacteria bacterium]|nr:hypothetical protein [Deltaproteobacteria bacterium]
MSGSRTCNTSGYGVSDPGYSYHDDDFDFYIIEDSYVVMPRDKYTSCCAQT